MAAIDVRLDRPAESPPRSEARHLRARKCEIQTKIVSQLETKIDRLGQSEEPPTTGQIRDLSVAAGIWTDKLGQWAGWEAKAPKARFSGGVGVQQNIVVGISTDDLIARAKNVTPQAPEEEQNGG